MDINQISPYVRIALSCLKTEPWKVEERVIFDYELLYVRSGIVKVTIEGKEYRGEKGDIFLFKPKQRHSIEMIPGDYFEQAHIHFDLRYDDNSRNIPLSFETLDSIPQEKRKLFREDLTTAENLNIPSYFRINNYKYFEDLVFSIIKEQKERMPYFELTVKGQFTRLLAFLMKEIYYSNQAIFQEKDREVRRIQEYIMRNVNKEITLDELSEYFNISKYYMVRLFKQYIGMTPIRYHQSLRLEMVKDRIMETSQSLTSIAEEFGFSSINSMSRAFKKIEKVAPSHYRYTK